MAKRTVAVTVAPMPRAAAEMWQVVLDHGTQREILAFGRADTARHYAEHARIGAWIGNKFHSDLTVTVIEPGQ